MNKVTDRLAALISVKTIVTFAITFVFVTLSLRGDISTDTVNSVVIMVIGFYFGSQYEQDRKRTHDTAETFGTTETTESTTTPVTRVETEGV